MDKLEPMRVMLEAADQLLIGERRVLEIHRGAVVGELHGEMLILYNQALIMGALRSLLGERVQARLDAAQAGR